MRKERYRLLVVDNRPELKFAVQFAQRQTSSYQFDMASSLEEARQKLQSNKYFGVLTTLLLPTQELPHLVVEVLRSECRRIVTAASPDEEDVGTHDKMWVECKKELLRQRLNRVANEEAFIEHVCAMHEGTCHWSPSQQRLYEVDYDCVEWDDEDYPTKLAFVPTVEGDVLPDDDSPFTSWYGVMMDAADLFPGTPHFGDLELHEAARAAQS